MIESNNSDRDLLLRCWLLMWPRWVQVQYRLRRVFNVRFSTSSFISNILFMVCVNVTMLVRFGLARVHFFSPLLVPEILGYNFICVIFIQTYGDRINFAFHPIHISYALNLFIKGWIFSSLLVSFISYWCISFLSLLVLVRVLFAGSFVCAVHKNFPWNACYCTK